MKTSNTKETYNGMGMGKPVHIVRRDQLMLPKSQRDLKRLADIIANLPIKEKK